MTGREGGLARPVAIPHIPFQNMKHCPAPLVSPNLDFFFSVPPFTIMGFNLKQRHIAFTECSGSRTTQNIYSFSPLRYHQSPHVCSHILRGGRFLLFSCRALFRNKSGTTELDTGPNTEESKPEGRLTRGRACRKLGGAGSSPKNTSIVETLRGFPIAYRHHPVKQQRARMRCRS